jgi:phage terminase large subunit GpA-like protein
MDIIKEKRLNKLMSSMFNYNERLTPVEWAEKYRYLSKEITRYPGKMSYKLTPYLKEIANSVDPTNISQIISVMKGSQVGLSIGGIFTILGWIISQMPDKVLFITENEAKIKDQMQNPINQMINSSGLSEKVGNHNLRDRIAMGRRAKGTGDTMEGMSFENGYLYTFSGQKIQSLSSWSVKYGLYDEVELYKGNYADSGSFLKLIEPRHKSYGNSRKLFFISTPLRHETSNIRPIYESGNQKKYMIPCPHCGEYIELLWSVDVDGQKAGITYKRDTNGRYIDGSTGYVCQKCGNFFKEKVKFDSYEEDLGLWIPTAEPLSKYYESFHISSLYAPIGFYDWEHCAKEWCMMHPTNAPVKYADLQTFYNQTLGLCWKDLNTTVDIKDIEKNCRDYKYGTIPNELSNKDGNGNIVLLTCSVDINGILGKTVEDDDIRLDYEVRAWSAAGSESFVTSYSVEHGSIGNFKKARKRDKEEREGKEQDYEKWTVRHGYENSVWKYFDEHVMQRQWMFDDGSDFIKIMLCGIDTGNFTVYANQYVSMNRLCIALKGASETKYTTSVDKKLYTKGSAKDLYLAHGNILKDRFSSKLALPLPTDAVQQPYGFLNFPRKDEQNSKYTYYDYFCHFEGEEKKIKKDAKGNIVGMMWEKKHNDSENHFLDCAVYNDLLCQISIDLICKNAKNPSSWENFVSIMSKKRLNLKQNNENDKTQTQ